MESNTVKEIQFSAEVQSRSTFSGAYVSLQVEYFRQGIIGLCPERTPSKKSQRPNRIYVLASETKNLGKLSLVFAVQDDAEISNHMYKLKHRSSKSSILDGVPAQP
ncbi:unnamed protein product [Dovyalis caffra]|uniref:Uncharacterized protein n=1 Tax=Dovyalis caffra TaxID=77055 RepID=A0AAV1SNB9_9ROSI|nr:unnamed protein product [Dovyalis caffra]